MHLWFIGLVCNVFDACRYRASGRGLGPGIWVIFGPCGTASSRWASAILGPKNLSLVSQSVHISATTPLTWPPLILRLRPLRIYPPTWLPLILPVRLRPLCFYPSDSAPFILPLRLGPLCSTPLTRPPFILPIRFRPLCTGGGGGGGLVEQSGNVTLLHWSGGAVW